MKIALVLFGSPAKYNPDTKLLLIDWPLTEDEVQILRQMFAPGVRIAHGMNPYSRPVNVLEGDGVNV